jgi:hypothetical protein
MLFLDGGLGLMLLGLWLFCLIDVITTDELLCRNLPKPAWVLIVLILFDVGCIAWLVAGRTWGPQRPSGAGDGALTAGRYPEYERPGRFPATPPDADEEFLRQCRERAEEQRRSYQARRDAERHAEDERGPDAST